MSDDRSPISGIQVAPSEDGSQITILFYGALAGGAGNYYGGTIGYSAGTARYRTRMFAPTGGDFAVSFHADSTAGVSLTPEVCEVLARDLADASKNCIELKKRTRH